MIARILWIFGVVALTVFARASELPKPNPEQQFSEMKLYNAAGQPWRVAQENWDAAKQHLRDDAKWRDWLKKEQSAVDRWIKKYPTDRVEWVCGWYHDFVSPKDGSHLEWTDEIPGEEAQFFHSESDPKVTLTPKLIGGWVFNFRSDHAGMMERAARLYRLTGEKRYADWSAAQLDFYATHYREWPAQRQNARLFSQSLDVATSFYRYCNVVRLLGDEISADRRESWRTQFFLPQIEETLKTTRMQIHNIVTWHQCAIAEFALTFGDEAQWRFALDSEFGLRAQVAKGITADSLWWEQSFGYNSYVVKAVQGLFVTAALYGRLDELAHELAVTENLMLGPIYLRFPNGDVPAPADVTAHVVAPDRKLLEGVYRVFPTALGLQGAQSRRDWETLLDPPSAPPAAVELPEVKSANLEASRMALLREGKWQVFFHYGQLTASHTQSEALNFSASYAGIDITHDTGTVGYGSPLHKDYYTRGLNHNVPLVAGEAEEKPPQRGELINFAPNKVSAAQPNYRRDAKAARTLEIKGDALIDIATIESASKSPQPLGLALHVQGKVQLPAGFAADENFAKDRPASFGYWRDVRKAEFTDEASFIANYQGVAMRVTFRLPGKFTVWHGSTPDEPPHRREGFYLEQKGAKAVFTTTFEPVK